MRWVTKKISYTEFKLSPVFCSWARNMWTACLFCHLQAFPPEKLWCSVTSRQFLDRLYSHHAGRRRSWWHKWWIDRQTDETNGLQYVTAPTLGMPCKKENSTEMRTLCRFARAWRPEIDLAGRKNPAIRCLRSAKRNGTGCLPHTRVNSS